VHDVVGAGDRPGGVRALAEFEPAAGLDGAFFEDAQVPPGAAGLDHTDDEIGDAPAAGLFPAGPSRLADLDDGGSEGVDVADADIGFGQTGDGEVFPEGARRDRMGEDLILPKRIVIGAVDEDGFVGSAVVLKIGVLVSGEPIAAHPDGARDAVLGGCGGPGLILRVRGSGLAVGADEADLDGGDEAHAKSSPAKVFQVRMRCSPEAAVNSGQSRRRA